MAKDRKVTFERLVVGMTIRHPNGTSYQIVSISTVRLKKTGKKVVKVMAKWRNGHIGRFGKDVVRIYPKHVLGFLRYRARRHRPRGA